MYSNAIQLRKYICSLFWNSFLDSETFDGQKFPAAAAAAKSLQSCPTLCDPIDGSPPGSSVPGIFQARALEWVAISFSNAWKWKVKMKLLSRVRLFGTPWTAAYQAPPSIGKCKWESEGHNIILVYYNPLIPYFLPIYFFPLEYLPGYPRLRVLTICAPAVRAQCFENS